MVSFADRLGFSTQSIGTKQIISHKTRVTQYEGRPLEVVKVLRACFDNNVGESAPLVHPGLACLPTMRTRLKHAAYSCSCLLAYLLSHKPACKSTDVTYDHQPVWASAVHQGASTCGAPSFFLKPKLAQLFVFILFSILVGQHTLTFAHTERCVYSPRDSTRLRLALQTLPLDVGSIQSTKTYGVVAHPIST
ncbi:hypothetical protein PTKIN_Ptkin12aG0164200 [Pterospermum kingtungense]